MMDWLKRLIPRPPITHPDGHDGSGPLDPEEHAAHAEQRAEELERDQEEARRRLRYLEMQEQVRRMGR